MNTVTSLNEYQAAAEGYALYGSEHAVTYPVLGLASEAGELAGKWKKFLRDGSFDRQGMIAELGDNLWYIALIARDLGISLSEVANRNLDKLEDRKVRDVLKGSGDYR